MTHRALLRHGPGTSRTGPLPFDQLPEVQAYLLARRGGGPVSSRGREAWDCFYSACTELLGRMMASCRLDAADRDDCVQAVWQELFRALPSFRDSGQPRRFYQWLGRIVRARAAEFRRYRARHPAVPLTKEVVANLVEHAAAPVPLGRPGVDETLAELRGRIPAVSWEAFRLHCLEGRPVRTVAASLHLPVRDVSYRIYRVRHALRSALRGEDHPGR